MSNERVALEIFCSVCGYSAERAIADGRPCLEEGHVLMALPARAVQEMGVQGAKNYLGNDVARWAEYVSPQPETA